MGPGAWGMGHRVPWAYLTFLRTAILEVGGNKHTIQNGTKARNTILLNE
ncbi:MAG: hypothetical protein QQW96_04960 [Tychonema bourrellyi B0820]|nr:hypothetical protein [Tychonema bourrellyi B0820]